MRARGAQVTDIVVLVVAADDRVMPQTDRGDRPRQGGRACRSWSRSTRSTCPAAKPELVKQELAGARRGGRGVRRQERVRRDLGQEGHEHRQAARDDPADRRAARPQGRSRRAARKGVVLEARVEQGRGVVASVLVQNGTLRVGDAFVAGQHYGRVRAMFDERGRPVKAAGPSTPVEVLGWNGTPAAGDLFIALRGRARGARDRDQARRRCTASRSSARAKAISLDRLPRADDAGRAERAQADHQGRRGRLGRGARRVARQARQRSEVQVRVIRQAVGQITESDVLLAAASDAIIVGFHIAARRARARAGRAREGRDPPLRHHLQGGRGREAGARGPAQARAQGSRARRRRGAPGVQALEGGHGRRLHGDVRARSRAPSKVRLLRDGDDGVDGPHRLAQALQGRRARGADRLRVRHQRSTGINDLKVGDVIEAFTIEELARTLERRATPRRPPAADAARVPGPAHVRRHRAHRAAPARRRVAQGQARRWCAASRTASAQRVHAAVAEVDHQDLWQRAALGVAVVSGERAPGRRAAAVGARRSSTPTPGAEVLDWQEQHRMRIRPERVAAAHAARDRRHPREQAARPAAQHHGERDRRRGHARPLVRARLREHAGRGRGARARARRRSQRAAGFVRHELAPRLGLREVPELALRARRLDRARRARRGAAAQARARRADRDDEEPRRDRAARRARPPAAAASRASSAGPAARRQAGRA